MDKDPPAPPADPLAGLVDIPLPPAVSLWPQTWPARVAIVLLIAALVATAWWLVRRHIANRYRRAALAELGRVGSDVPALALLVRRTALAAFPRGEVASLSGADWLAFLDRSYGGTGFSQGPGQALTDAPYAIPPVVLGEATLGARASRPRSPAAPAEGETGRRSAPMRAGGPHPQDLVPLVRRWIRTHHA